MMCILRYFSYYSFIIPTLSHCPPPTKIPQKIIGKYPNISPVLLALLITSLRQPNDSFGQLRALVPTNTKQEPLPSSHTSTSAIRKANIFPRINRCSFRIKSWILRIIYRDILVQFGTMLVRIEKGGILEFLLIEILDISGGF